jgi:hypothetical protein
MAKEKYGVIKMIGPGSDPPSLPEHTPYKSLGHYFIGGR